MTPITHEERILNGEDLQPINRKEAFIKRIYDKTQVVPEPITREEWFLKKAAEGSGDITIEQLNVSQNGTYSEQGKAYSPVIVNVPAPVLKTKNITANGTYSASADNADGYSSVEVTVAPPENSFVLTTKKDDIVDISDAADIPVVDLKADVSSADEVMVGVGDGENFIQDNAPYLFRPTLNHTAEVKEMKEVLVGGSVAWNQLVKDKNSTISHGITYSIINNVVSLNGTADGQFITTFATPVKDHVMFVDVKYNGTPTQYVKQNSTGSFYDSKIYKHTYQDVNAYYFTVPDEQSIDETFTLRIHDLTLALGSQIANYVYALETSEAGSGIAWLKSQGFFTKDYYPYNAGGIKSVKTSAKKVVGFNQWDEQWNVSGSGIKAKNLIPVFPNTTYFFKSPCTAIVYKYDSDKNVLGSGNGIQKDTTFTTLPNQYYMWFDAGSFYGSTTYNNDICINLHWDGERDGEYEPYEEYTYPLDSDLELRGIPKLVDGKIKYDGDTYASDGSVKRRFGADNLGNLTWTEVTMSNNRTAYYASQLEMMGIPLFDTADITTQNMIQYGTDFTWAYQNQSSWAVNSIVLTRNAGILPSNSLGIITNTGDYNNAEAFKSAMTNKYLVYELATPITESADEYTNPQIVDNWGTEEFVDERDVPIPVGHESDYFDGDIYFSYIYDANGDKAVATGTADLITGEVTGGNHCDTFVIHPAGDNVVASDGEVEVKYLVPLEEL